MPLPVAEVLAAEAMETQLLQLLHEQEQPIRVAAEVAVAAPTPLVLTEEAASSSSAGTPRRLLLLFPLA